MDQLKNDLAVLAADATEPNTQNLEAQPLALRATNSPQAATNSPRTTRRGRDPITSTSVRGPCTTDPVVVLEAQGAPCMVGQGPFGFVEEGVWQRTPPLCLQIPQPFDVICYDTIAFDITCYAVISNHIALPQLLSGMHDRADRR